MAVLTSVLGYASLGFATRCYALGIQRRNVLESEYIVWRRKEEKLNCLADSHPFLCITDLGGHAFLMTAFGAVGYYFHGLEGRQNQAIQAKKEQILKNREALAALHQSEGDEE